MRIPSFGGGIPQKRSARRPPPRTTQPKARRNYWLYESLLSPQEARRETTSRPLMIALCTFTQEDSAHPKQARLH
jgi:hypothetical protein